MNSVTHQSMPPTRVRMSRSWASTKPSIGARAIFMGRYCSAWLLVHPCGARRRSGLGLGDGRVERVEHRFESEPELLSLLLGNLAPVLQRPLQRQRGSVEPRHRHVSGGTLEGVNQAMRGLGV